MAPRHPGDDGSGGGLDLSSMLPLLLMNRNSAAGGSGGEMPWVQMLLAILLPLLLRLFTPKLQSAVNAFRVGGHHATRTISCMKETGVYRWWDDKEDEDAFNAIVQKAILTYINKV